MTNEEIALFELEQQKGNGRNRIVSCRTCDLAISALEKIQRGELVEVPCRCWDCEYAEQLPHPQGDMVFCRKETSYRISIGYCDRGKRGAE